MNQPDALTLNIGSRTDVGRVRSHNEDSLLVSDPLFVVADGMGGHEAGEVASEIAVNTIAAAGSNILDGATLREAVIQSNRAVIQGAQTGRGRPGMGTTLTAAFITGSTLFIAQVGDSRAYLLHEGILQQVTHDHSLMAELIDAGQITEEQARVHPNRSIITRALGSDPATEPDIFELTLVPGDRLLLCSDGLSGMVLDDGLQEILSRVPDPQKAADALIEAANNAGGQDNITAVVVDAMPPQKAKRSKKRRLHLSVIAFIVVLVTLVGVAVGGIYLYAYNYSAYLIDKGGTVQVYRGLTGQLAGMSLTWFYEDTGIPVNQLESSIASKLEQGIPCGSLGEAEEVADSYRSQLSAQTISVNPVSASTSTSTSKTSGSSPSASASTSSSAASASSSIPSAGGAQTTSVSAGL